MEKKQLDAYMLSGPWEPITPYTIVDPDRLRQEIEPLDEIAMLVPMMQAVALRITKILNVISNDEMEEAREAKGSRRKRS